VASLDDSNADDFFRQGDDGTYSGGPGDSIPAGVVNVFGDLEEDTLPRLTPEQIERRDRYTYWVTRLVGALGVSAALAIGVRTVGASADDAPRAVTIPPPAAAAPVAPATAPVAITAPVVEAESVEAVAPEPTRPAPAAPAVAEVEPVKAAEQARPSEEAPRREKASSAARNAVRGPRASSPPASAPPPRTTPLPSLGHSSPPTAYFPD
jgi:hypothetical protein